MEAPPVPKDDLARVGSLRRLGILDTEPEDRFDRVTRIARQMFGVNTALVNLVDVDRQWAKSRNGLEPPGVARATRRSESGRGTHRASGTELVPTTRDLPREFSFCAHAIVSRDVLEVTDAAADVRFSDNPLVTGEPPVRFYAGCPIASPDGAVIGTLCLLDEQPRSLDENERAALRDLASVVEREIAMTRLAVDDELTGLVNRRGFTLIGSQALAFCERQEVDALAVVATVDGLALVNEGGGRSAGDQLLKMAGSTVADMFRASDVVGRVGGDRFAALLTGWKGSEAQVADRLLSAVAARNLELERTTFGLSMTVAFARFHHRTPELVDELLLEAEAEAAARKAEGA